MRRRDAAPARDLWFVLRARIAEGDRLAVRVPPLSWRVVAAAAAAVATVVVVPEPLRFLTASGLL
jgi:hypothetical protein